MRKACLWLLLLLFAVVTKAQEFSNKGKDFWLCFPSHVPNEKNGVTYYARMSLFITADKNSSGTVSIPGLFNTNFTVAAGQVAEVDVPSQLAHINTAEAASVIRKGIRVQVAAGKPPVVVYAHIYAGYRSAASLILPTAVLGKQYYSMNAPQVSISGSQSQFLVVAVDSNTTVLITPVRDGIKAPSFTVRLPLPGDVYEWQSDDDLSGSRIESVSPDSEPCKRIAVFSGSSAIHIATDIGCTPGDSYDPLLQQLYPVTAWGKRYGFIPFEGYINGNPYRILAAEDNTRVTVNGFAVATLNAGEYYPTKPLFGQTETQPVMIEADKSVSVAQYAQSSGCSGANPPAGTGYGDPDMVMLNPIEQRVNNITVFASQKENIYANARFINVVIKQQSTGSFAINGIAPSVTWQPLLPAGSGYASAKIPLPANLNAFTLQADSAFNVIAYGFGDFESYAYSAGTNVKDLYRTLTLENEFGNGDVPVGCNNSAFRLSVTYPYEPQSIRFAFYGLFPDTTVMNPVPVELLLVNGKIVYRYRLDKALAINQAGVYPLTVIAANNNSTGCNNGLDEIDYELTIVDKPVAEFTSRHSGCIADAVQFTDAAVGGSHVITGWYWDWGDHTTGSTQSPVHSYAAYGNYIVKQRVINDIGCGSDTAVKIIEVARARIQATAAAENCLGETTNILVATKTTVNTSINRLYWSENATAYNDTLPAPGAVDCRLPVLFPAAGSQQVQVYGIASPGCNTDTLTLPVYINSLPVAAFNTSIPACEQQSIPFTDASTTADGVIQKWHWDAGNGLQSSTQSTALAFPTGSWLVTLWVETDKGCRSAPVLQMVNVSPFPVADFKAPVTCVADPFVPFTNESTIADGSSLLYKWYFGDKNATTANPDSSILKDATHAYTVAGRYAVTLQATSASGCRADTIKYVTVNGAQLTAAFNSAAFPALCNNEPVVLQDASLIDAGSVIRREIYWNYDNDPLQQTIDATPQPGAGYTFQYPVTTTDQVYHIKYIVYSGNACLQQLDTVITIKHAPVVQFDVLKGVCADAAPFYINAARETSGSQGSGVYGGAGIDAGGLFSAARAGVGEHAIEYIFTGANGCNDTAVERIAVYALPTIYAGPDKTIKAGDSLQLYASGRGEHLQYQWSPAAYINDPYLLQPIVAPPADITYTLTGTTDKGCTANDAVYIKVIDKVPVPNAFTPDNDGKNDTWKIPYLEVFEHCTVRVYSRWGELVYQSTGYRQPWNGQHKGKPLPPGAYTYIIDLRNGQLPLKGVVLLVR